MALEQELQLMLLQHALDLAYDDMYEAHEAHGYQMMDMNNEEQQKVELPLMRLCSNDDCQWTFHPSLPFLLDEARLLAILIGVASSPSSSTRSLFPPFLGQFLQMSIFALGANISSSWNSK